MPTITEHPAQAELKDFLLGRLPNPRRLAVEAHVAECDRCCAMLRDVPNDTFAERFKEQSTAPADTRLAGVSVADQAFHNGLPVELQQHPRYRIVKELGRGGMGVVYLAEHTIMERPVALKVISRGLVANSRAVDRFRQEVKAAAKLSHPNIVTAHDAEHAGGLHFLVMEYIEGISVAQFVQKRGPLSVPQACNVIKQVARGLQHAHEKGMVHRDIKPQNLLITKKGQVKVLDFGLAKLLHNTDDEQLTDVEMVLGTPDYIAPEQAYNSQNVDIRSDLYSLGCTFYFLLTGRPPFRDGSAMDKLLKHAETLAKPVHEVRAEIPATVSAVVAKLMAKKPGERFQTPIELLQALTDLPTEKDEIIPVLELVESGPAADTAPLAQAPTPLIAPRDRVKSTPPTPPMRRVKKRAPRRPVWVKWAGLAAMVLVLAGGLGYGLVALLRNDDVNKGDTDPVPLVKNGGTANKDKNPITNGGQTNARPRVLLMIPAQNFWYPDYIQTRTGFANRADVKVVSTRRGTAYREAQGGGENVPIDFSIEDVRPEQFDVLLVLGGTGVRDELLRSESAKKLFQATHAANKIVGSQCVGASVLAEAGLIQSGQRVTCPDFEWAKSAVQQTGATITGNPVEVNGRVLTARDPKDGPALAQKVLELWNAKR